MKLQDAVAALNAAREAVRENTVTPEVLISRQHICSTCPMRGPVRGIKSNVGQVLARLTVKHKVPKDIAESMCKVCGCPLQLLLASLPENLHVDSVEESKKRPGHCWMREIKPA